MENFLKQWWDKRILWVWLGLALVHGLAAIVQHHQALSLIALGCIGAATLVLTFRSLPLGLALAFLEIFVGGHGHLIEAPLFGFSLSLRIVLFAAVMIGWGLLVIAKRAKPHFNKTRDLPLLLIAIAVLIGTVKGFLTNDPTQAFDDMNGYLTLFYVLPIISITWTNENKRLLLLTLMTGATWVAATTLLLFFAFTHLPGKALYSLYTFVRDARLAEITLLTGNKFSHFLGATPWYFRIFQQSQAVLMAFILLFVASCYQAVTLSKKEIGFAVSILGLSLAGFIAGQSRSLFIGLVAGALILMPWLILTLRLKARVWRTKAIAGTAAVGALIALFALAIVPLPPRPDLSQAAFYKKDAGDARDLAVSSRWSLLPPMMNEILAHPIIGSGFGENVTFISDDPRLRAINPSGEVTTYRFEWGYQDLWLKMGILGLLSFFWYYLTLGAVTVETLRRDPQSWLTIGWLSAITSLYAANVFTPFLNHPIGLGLLLAALPFFDWSTPTQTVTAADHVTTRSPGVAYQPSVAPQESRVR